MPLVEITTNVANSDFDIAAALKAFTTTAAASIGLPKEYFLVVIKPDAALAFAGTTEAAANANVAFIGDVARVQGREAAITAALSAEVEKQLGVASHRLFVQFTEKQTSEWGWKGTTFEKLM